MGSPGHDVEQLVHTLVEDRLIGFTTSQMLIDEGDALSKFGEVETAREVADGR